MIPAMVDVRIEPATAATWDDLQQILGARGGAAACQCQRAILPLREYWDMPREIRQDLLRREVTRPGAVAPGLIAYLDDEPAGWCRLGPRCQYAPLRNSPVPWAQRAQDKDDATVWAVVCFAVRAGYRKRGVTYALAAAAVDHARRHGAAALEAYPMASDGSDVPWGELHVGTCGAFVAAGLEEVTHPSKRRYVFRIDFAAPGRTSGPRPRARPRR